MKHYQDMVWDTRAQFLLHHCPFHSLYGWNFLKVTFNPFPANVPCMKKPVSWVLQAKRVKKKKKKHLWKSDILSKDVVR